MNKNRRSAFFSILALTLAFPVYLVLAADTGSAASESRQLFSNPVRLQAAAKSSKPDLVVSKINFSPGSPMVGAEITIWIFVKNNGPVPADASELRLKVGGESNPPTVPVPPLNSNAEFRYSKTVSFDRAGNFILTATADAGGSVVESNEGNNVKTATVVVAALPKPDLVVTKINFSPGQPKQSEHITYWVFVKNTGAGEAGESTLSISDSLNANPIWHTAQVPALPPGTEWRFEGPRQYNQAGTYTLKAVIDRLNRIEETDENNNTLTRDIKVYP